LIQIIHFFNCQVFIWTCSSIAIEGNTFTLGDTFELLEYGLTVSGKPISEHQEVMGHAKAITLIYFEFAL